MADEQADTFQESDPSREPNSSSQEAGPMTNRRLAEAITTTVVFVVSAALFGWLGLSNLSGALTYGGRFVGAVLVASALFLAVSVYALWDDCRRRKLDASGPIALLGAIIALLGAVLLLLTAVASGDLYSRIFWSGLPRWGWTSLYLLGLIILTLGSGSALFLALRRQARLPSPKQIGIAALSTAVLAAANFGYSQLYQPSAQPPLITVSAELGPAVRATDGSGLLLPLNITFKNPGQVDVYVLGAIYAVYGRRADADRDTQTWPRRLKNLESDEEVSSQVNWHGYDFIQTDNWQDFGGWLNRATEGSVRKVVRLVDPVDYDQLTVKADAVISRRDRARMDMEDRGALAEKDATSVWFRYRIHEGNKVSEIIRLRRFLDVYWTVGTNANQITSGLSYSALPERTEIEGSKTAAPDSPPDMNHQDMYNRYGLQVITTWWTHKSLLDAPAPG